jgi:iron-sulfur cluster assembly protein
MCTRTASTQMSIQLTSTAQNRIRHFMQADQAALGLRFGVRKVGCSGWVYQVDVATSTLPDDEIFEIDDVKVFVDQASLPIVDGTEIDFQRNGLNASFVFNNPNAIAACGCGESFSVVKAAI